MKTRMELTQADLCEAVQMLVRAQGLELAGKVTFNVEPPDSDPRGPRPAAVTAVAEVRPTTPQRA